MSRLKLEEPERDSLPHPGTSWDMPYSGTYLPHSSPMPFNYTNETTCYSLTRDGSGSGMRLRELYSTTFCEYFDDNFFHVYLQVVVVQALM